MTRQHLRNITCIMVLGWLVSAVWGCAHGATGESDPHGWKRVAINDTLTLALPSEMHQEPRSSPEGAVVFRTDAIVLRVSAVRAIDGHSFESGRMTVVDGRLVRLVRFRNTPRLDRRPLGFAALFHDVGDGRGGVLFLADCADAAAQDVIARIVTSVRFLPTPSATPMPDRS